MSLLALVPKLFPRKSRVVEQHYGSMSPVSEASARWIPAAPARQPSNSLDTLLDHHSVVSSPIKGKEGRDVCI